MAQSLSSLSVQNRLKVLGVFLGLLVLFAGLANYALIEFSGRQRYYTIFFMITPGIAALLTAALFKIPGIDMGLKLAPGKTLFASYIIPLLYGSLAYGIIWTFFSNGYGNSKIAESLAQWMGVIDWQDNAVYTLFTLLMMTIGVAQQMIPTLGVEMGLRGFLAPIILPRFGFLGTAFVTALIYTAMHVPIILYAGYNAGPKGLEYQIGSFAISAMALAIIGLYYRLKTGSILPGALFHASHLVLILFAFGEVTSKSEETWRYAGEFGIITPALLIPVAFLFFSAAKAKGYTQRTAFTQ